MSNDEKIVRLPTSYDEARKIVTFVERTSDVLHGARKDRARGVRFPLLVLDASLDRDREIYAQAPSHRRIAFVSPDGCQRKRVPSATLVNLADATADDLRGLIDRRYEGDSGKARSECSIDHVIALANVSHHGNAKETHALVEKCFALGIQYVVLLVHDPDSLTGVVEKKGNIVLFRRPPA